ncbi:hypothetical protein PF008_g2681 [Phytophthora fragariae]|uniref:Uncharacterized protein n=1 Tax=Phytophthora fragariae TaxID=53985 RepID=A0A6G0SHJ6_9STRA|nr:hypothetical protein PF008_g2681 [Phytophthora fragariae]
MSNTAGGNTTGAAAAPHFGSNKPPKFDEEGFDLYKAMLQSYLMQRDAWGILDGTDTLDPNASAAETQRFQEKNALARDALLRGVIVKDATKTCMLTSARDTWVAFEQEKTRRDFSNALYLRKKLYT